MPDERIEITPKGRMVAQILGPSYQVLQRGYQQIEPLCIEAWGDGKVPLVYGRKGIGKSGVLRPYLESRIEDIFIIESGSDRIVPDLSSTRFMCLLSVEQNFVDNQIAGQLRYLGNTYPLPQMLEDYEAGELLLHPTLEVIRGIAKALYSDQPSFSEDELNSRRWGGSLERVSGILNDNSRPYTLREGMNELQRAAARSDYFRPRRFWFL